VGGKYWSWSSSLWSFIHSRVGVSKAWICK
jgi:hypothetical protein